MMGKVETTAGVDAAPQETNSYEPVRLIEPFTIDITQENIEVTGGLGSLGYSRPYATVRPAGVTFRTFVQGIDATTYTATVKPPIGQWLRACGMIESFVSSNASGVPQYDYTPANRVQSQTSLTMVAHVDGYEHRMTAGMGNCNIIGVAATPFIAEFTMRGVLTTEASTTRGTPVGFPSNTPPRWIGSGSIFVSSLGAVIENLNFNTNNTVFEQRASLAPSGSGIIKILITERAPGGSFDPEMTTASSYDWINAWRSTSGSLLQVRAGTVQGNTFTLVCSQAISKTLARQDKSGLAVFGIDWQAYEVAGGDDFRISFT